MWIQEAIQRGNLRLRELEEDQVRLMRKIALMDEYIRELETKISQALCINSRMGPCMGNPTTTLADCCQELVTIL